MTRTVERSGAGREVRELEGRSPSNKRARLAIASVVALVFGVGATVGDIGSCGKSPDNLDASVFASARKSVDCQRCTECGLTTERCAIACSDAGPTETFPPNCAPLYQDGVVCLRALLSASCSDYASYVSDSERLVPTECEFCRGDAAP